MVAVESGWDRNAYVNDPMQVNNRGDWATKKANWSLTEGEAPGQALGIVAGIGWLSEKAFEHDSTGARSRFRGWDEAVQRYNQYNSKGLIYLNKVNAARARIKSGC